MREMHDLGDDPAPDDTDPDWLTHRSHSWNVPHDRIDRAATACQVATVARPRPAAISPANDDVGGVGRSCDGPRGPQAADDPRCGCRGRRLEVHGVQRGARRRRDLPRDPRPECCRRSSGSVPAQRHRPAVRAAALDDAGRAAGRPEQPLLRPDGAGVERAAFGFGYTTMFCNIEGSADMAVSGVDPLLGQRVAGIIMLGPDRATITGPRRPPRGRRANRIRRTQRDVGRLGRPPRRPGRAPGDRASAGPGARADRVRPHAPGGAQRRPGPLSGYRATMRRRGLQPLPAFVWIPGSDQCASIIAIVPFEAAMTGAGRPNGVLRLQRHRARSA